MQSANTKFYKILSWATTLWGNVESTAYRLIFFLRMGREDSVVQSQRVQRGQRGRRPQLRRVLAHRPDLLAQWSVYTNTLSDVEKEAIACQSRLGRHIEQLFVCFAVTGNRGVSYKELVKILYRVGFSCHEERGGIPHIYFWNKFVRDTLCDLVSVCTDPACEYKTRHRICSRTSMVVTEKNPVKEFWMRDFPVKQVVPVVQAHEFLVSCLLFDGGACCSPNGLCPFGSEAEVRSTSADPLTPAKQQK